MEKFSLFQVEKKYRKMPIYVGEFMDVITEKCFIYIDSYDSLEDVKVAQKELINKSLIMKTYE